MRLWRRFWTLGLCLGVMGCSSSPQFYRNNQVLNYTEYDEPAWLLVSMSVLSRTRVLQNFKAAIPAEQGTPQFKSSADYDLSRFYFLEPRKDSSQKLALPRFLPVQLKAKMLVAGISYPIYEFEVLAGRFQGRRFHTFAWEETQTITTDESLARERVEQSKRSKMRKKIQRESK